MVRRRWSLAFCLLIAAVATSAYAWGSRAIYWTRAPSITVIAEAGDARTEAVREAIEFWNRTFRELKSPFRLGKVTWVTGSVPGDDARSLRHQALERYPGDVLIVLSNATFVSFTAHVGNRVVVGIKNGNTWPLSLPNVLRNVVTHELGHVVGLGHNSDPELLMCGRPASCRPDAFASATSRIFALSEEERNRLMRSYPGGRKARAIWSADITPATSSRERQHCGDPIVMGGRRQEDWMQCVPKSDAPLGGRVIFQSSFPELRAGAARLAHLAPPPASECRTCRSEPEQRQR